MSSQTVLSPFLIILIYAIDIVSSCCDKLSLLARHMHFTLIKVTDLPLEILILNDRFSVR